LVEIDVAGPKPAKRRFELLLDLGSGKAEILFAHREIELGREHVGIARPCGQRLAEEAFGRSATIDVRRVDQVDPEVERLVDAGPGPILLDSHAVGQPRAEGNFGDLEVARS
jgi:hypothetical protein